MTILVVEDDPGVGEVAAAVLETFGHEVLTATSADGALALIEGGQSAVTHVFADVNMSGELNGFTLARLLSTLYPDIKVVITSGDPSVRDEAAQHALAFVAKPWTRSDLGLAVGYQP